MRKYKESHRDIVINSDALCRLVDLQHSLVSLLLDNERRGGVAALQRSAGQLLLVPLGVTCESVKKNEDCYFFCMSASKLLSLLFTFGQLSFGGDLAFKRGD